MLPKMAMKKAIRATLELAMISTMILGTFNPVFAQDEITPTPESIPSETPIVVETFTEVPTLLPTIIPTTSLTEIGTPTVTFENPTVVSTSPESMIATPTETQTPAASASPDVYIAAEGESDNPIPVLAYISPEYSSVGSIPFTISITGSNFINGSSVKWIYQYYSEGTELITTFVDSNHLTAEVPTSLLIANVYNPSLASITVVNPIPGGGTSNAITHTVIGYKPTYDEKLQNEYGNFRWSTIPNATQYTLQVSLSENFDTYVINTALSNNQYEFYFENSQTYYWRIKPGFASTWGD
jgi:hypothetical protein